MGYLWPGKANLSSGKASRCFLVSLVIPQPPLWAKTDNSDKGSEGLFEGKGVSRTSDTNWCYLHLDIRSLRMATEGRRTARKPSPGKSRRSGHPSNRCGIVCDLRWREGYRSLGLVGIYLLIAS